MGIQIYQCTVSIVQGFVKTSFQIGIVHIGSHFIGPFQQAVFNGCLLRHRLVIDRRCRLVGRGTSNYSDTNRHPHQKHSLAHPLGKTEIETTSLTRLTINAETADLEQLIGLAVLFYNSLAVHQSEARPFVLHQGISIGGRLHTNLAGIVYLFTQNPVDILCRKSDTGIGYRYFHIIGLFTGCYLHPSPGRCILAGILGQRIDHEEGQSPVGLNIDIGTLHFQRQILSFESTPAFQQHIEQPTEAEVFDIEMQGTLTHLDPQRQYVIVFIDASREFTDVAVLTFLDGRVGQIIVSNEFMHFVNDTVNIRSNTRNNEQTSLLDHILALVLDKMTFIHILFLFEELTTVAQGDQGKTVFQCPCDIRSYDL